MKILALPNAFKGSLCALRAARILQQTLCARHEIKAFPVSDGGDGFLDFFRTLDPRARLIHLTAKNAFLKNKKTCFLMLSDGKTAAVETARVCGLGTAKKEDLDALGASSYGVGQAILKAVRAGATTIYVGLGGVACNDGGAGMAQALGARLLDKNGRFLPPGAKELHLLAFIDVRPLRAQLKGVRIYAVADVDNPMLGPRGSARVFGPQKGATPAQVKALENALTIYARAVQKATGKDIAHTPGTAAAGAIGAGLYGLCRAKFLLGSDFLFKKAGFEKYFKWADLVITAEGKLDAQTFCGKAPLAVLKLAKKHGKPVLFICGRCEEKALQGRPCAPRQIAVLTDFAKDVQDAQKNAAYYLRRVCKSI